jgi:hypothetical protein
MGHPEAARDGPYDRFLDGQIAAAEKDGSLV